MINVSGDLHGVKQKLRIIVKSKMVSTKEKVELATAISEIIPLDAETCNQMVDYALTLSSEAEITQHFLDMLGESDASSAFLQRFFEIKRHTNNKKQVRQEPPVSNIPQKSKGALNPWKAEKPAEKEVRSASPAVKSSSHLTSDLVKDKQKDQPKDNRKTRKKQLDNLKDLESLLNSLEVSNPEDRDTRTACFCNATRHPLFEIAPNCMNCGKIICAREGLQPCSFCGHELLSAKDRSEIKEILLKEKLELDSKAPATKERKPEGKSHKANKIVITMNAGENLWKAQDEALKKAEAEKKLKQEQLAEENRQRELEESQHKELQYYEQVKDVDKDLVAAQERLNTLLLFQDNGAERTKIIDNAADYELSSSNSGNMWLSATERALKLKKQQRQLRKYEESENSRTGKGGRTVEMVIKDGKVTMVEKYSTKSEDVESNDIKDLENQIHESKKKHEDLLAKNIWDYEADQNKWEKPVYQNMSSTNNDFNIPELKKRVQLDTSADPNELVVKLY